MQTQSVFHTIFFLFLWYSFTLLIFDNQDSEVCLRSAAFYKNPLKPTFWTDNLQASSLSLEAAGPRSLAWRAGRGPTQRALRLQFVLNIWLSLKLAVSLQKERYCLIFKACWVQSVWVVSKLSGEFLRIKKKKPSHFTQTLGPQSPGVLVGECFPSF